MNPNAKMKRLILILLILPQLTAQAEQTPLAELISTENYVYKNATNAQNESLVLPKCAAQSTIKRSFWLQSGIRKKQLDNEYKENEILSSREESTTTEIVGYDYDGRPLTKTVVSSKPTQYTEDVYRMREAQWERSSDKILEGVTGLTTFGSLWRLLK